MRKYLALLLALCMVFALCACGQSEAPAQEAPAEDAAEAPAEDAAVSTEGWAPDGPVTMIVDTRDLK